MAAGRVNVGDGVVIKATGAEGIVSGLESIRTGGRGRPKTAVAVKLIESGEIATYSLGDLRIA